MEILFIPATLAGNVRALTLLKNSKEKYFANKFEFEKIASRIPVCLYINQV